MTSQVKTVNNTGIGFFGLLAVLFIALKLTNVINWSWWLVLLPLYGPPAFGLAIFVLVFVGVSIISIFSGSKKRW